MIKLTDLSIMLGSRELVRGIDLSLSGGEIVALVGANGSGKTTLCRAILGSPLFFGKLDGSIELDGVLANSLSRKEIAKKISYMPQLLPLPDMTVFELCASARAPYLDGIFHRIGESDRVKINDAIARMGISHLSLTKLSHLSGGERQSAFFAMLLSGGAPYVILDEPTSSLDYKNKDKLFSSVRLLRDEGVGVLAVFHSLEDAVSLADRILLLDGGEGHVFSSAESFAFSPFPERVFGVKAHKHGENIYFR